MTPELRLLSFKEPLVDVQNMSFLAKWTDKPRELTTSGEFLMGM